MGHLEFLGCDDLGVAGLRVIRALAADCEDVRNYFGTTAAGEHLTGIIASSDSG